MATLTGNSIASTYKQLLKVTSEGIGADASAKYIEDGLGTDSALSISTTRVGIGTAAPASLLNIKSAVSTTLPTAISSTYHLAPYPHELFIENTANNETYSFAGIALSAGTQSSGSHAMARIAAVKDGAVASSSNLVFMTKTPAGVVTENMRIVPTGRVKMHYGAHVKGKASFVLTGSINVTGTNVNVPGTGTKYLSELVIGDDILVSGETRTIASISDDTTATVTAAWGSDLSDDASPECNPAAFTVIRDTGAIGMVLDDGGNVGIGTAAPVSGQNWSQFLQINHTTNAALVLTETDSTQSSDIATNGAGMFIDVSGHATATNNNIIFRTEEANSNYSPTERMRISAAGNVGIGTAAAGQLLDVNSGGGNMIADGYDTHSLAVYKENIEDASGYLDKVLACPAQKWNRKPFVSANEIKEAVLEEFGEDVLIEEAVEAQDAVYETIVVQEAVEEELWSEEDDLPEGIEAGDVKTEAQEEETEEQLVSEAIEAKDAVYEKQYSVWDELFPEDNSHRQKALYNMPDGDLKTWIDDWCEAKRVEMRPENKWQKKRLGLVADAELTAEHLPEVVSINDDGEPTGIDTMTYIGILHNAIQELSAKVEALENA